MIGLWLVDSFEIFVSFNKMLYDAVKKNFLKKNKGQIGDLFFFFSRTSIDLW